MASKSKRRRRVLGASCILAALIVGASSFAWFTSKDEVTNRLSASADYGVTIAEDFTPPENWVPGQTIDKNVGVVNTGNVDAFVRAWLEGEMRIVTEKDNLTTYSSKNMMDNNATSAVLLDSTYTTTTMLSTYTTPGRLTLTTDQTFKDLDLNYSYVVGTTTYLLRELNKTDLLMNSATTNHSAASPDAYTGVMGVQAGGKLAFAENDSEFYFTPNQAISITNNATSPITYNIAADTPIKVKYDKNATTSITYDSGTTTYTINSLDVLEGVDTNTFAPATTGLYVFERNKALDANGDDYEFSGYYYIQSGTEDGTAANQGTYFALHNDVTDNRSDNVLPDTAYSIVKNADGSITFTPTKSYVSTKITGDTTDQIYTQVGSDWYDRYGVQVTSAIDLGTLNSQTKTSGSVSLFTAQQETKKNTDLDWTWTDATETTPAMLSAFYDVDSDDTADVDEVKVNIALSNLYGTNKYPSATGIYTNNEKGNNWTALGTTTAAYTTFYYNDDLEEGATTAKLVDSVTLDSNVTKDAYLAFDFDLNVKMDSVQVTYDENGNETVTAAQSTFTSGAPTNITSVTNGVTAPEAGALTWTNS